MKTQFSLHIGSCHTILTTVAALLVSLLSVANDDIDNALRLYGSLNTSAETSYDPGFLNTRKIENYKTALAAVKSLTGNESATTIAAAISALRNTYEAAQQQNPISEGYYYIVSAGNGPGYSGGPYDYEWRSALYNDGDLVKWKTFDPDDLSQIYYFSPAAGKTWNVFSVMGQSYISAGEKPYDTKVHTTADAQISQVFNQANYGKYSFNSSNNSYIYAVTSSHNGTSRESGDLSVWGTVDEAAQYAVNVWYIHRVSDDVIDRLNQTAAGLRTLCKNYQTLAEGMQTTDAPGFHKAANVEQFKNVISQISARDLSQCDEAELQTLAGNLRQAYETALETTPVTDGYYYITNNSTVYTSAHKAPAALYTASRQQTGNGLAACRYDTYSPTNANYIYQISATNTDGQYTVRNAYTGYSLNSSDATDFAIKNCTAGNPAPQIFTWQSGGRFFIADASCPGASLCISTSTASAKNGFAIVTNGQYADPDGYDTWSLTPVSQSDVEQIIQSQTEADLLKAQSYDRMKHYCDSISDTYNKIINDNEGGYDTQAVEELKQCHTAVIGCIDFYDYDVTSTAADYDKALNLLSSALDRAINTKPDDNTSHQLNGIPIGAESVDYSSGLPSTTVNTPADAFDDDFSTCYAAYERSTGYVGLDLGKKHIITQVAYAPRSNWDKRLVLGVFEGANKPDFSDAIPIYIIKDLPEYNKLTFASINCSRGFRYVRYIGPNDARCNIAEMRFFGKEGEGDDSRLYQLTNLPLVVMRTDANVVDVSSRTTWLTGHVNIIYDNGTALKTDSMTVRGRGNGSWTFEKKPYKIKLNEKTRMPGMPANAREWTLINNYGDKTMIRNNVAFKLSEIFEMDYTPACTLVDVVFNGQYKGSYQLCDQIEVRKNRVDITEMTTSDNIGDALSGGYLIEIDAYAGAEPKHFTSDIYGIPVTVHYPKSDKITTAQFNYIRNQFNKLCSSVYSPLYKSELEGYQKHLDEESWLKYFLIEELSGNTDGYWSVYLTKDRNDKFRVSPVWDFDLAFDNDRRTHPILTMADFLSLNSKSSAANGVRDFNRKIVESCSRELTKLWSWYRYRGNLNYEYLSAVVDSLGRENQYSQEYNYMRWPILNTCVQQQYITRGSYKAEVDFINEYLYDRIAWLDNKVGLEEPIGIHDTTDDPARGGIHGHSGYLLVRGFKENSVANIYSANGTLMQTIEISEFHNQISLPKGVYIVKVTEPDGHSTTQKTIVY